MAALSDVAAADTAKGSSEAQLVGSGKCVLVTGGAGYIGSHTSLLLLESGYDVVVMDSLVNSSAKSLERVRALTQCDPDRLLLLQVDLCNSTALSAAFQECPQFHACIHFAGLKAVGESVHMPLHYYNNNIVSTLNLMMELEKTSCRKLVFSSSATVYGTAAAPITESSKVGEGITNPYGRTKFFIEEILRDFCKSHILQAVTRATSPAVSPVTSPATSPPTSPGPSVRAGAGAVSSSSRSSTISDSSSSSRWNIECLRYFNPVGAHESGDIGEDPSGPPNNLTPYLSQVAVGRRPCVTVYGSDYDTPDGTGVRDYVHVLDLAEGHLKAIAYLDTAPKGWHAHNLGTGRGYSVLAMISAMEKASGRPVPYTIGPRRPGDLATVYAGTALAAEELHWTSTRDLECMMQDLWAWQSKHPNGYS